VIGPIPPELADFIVKSDLDERFWSDSICLFVVVQTAKWHGLLPGIDVHALVAESRHDERFLVVVELAPDLRIASPPIPWSDVVPAAASRGSGTEPLRQLLVTVTGIADGLATNLQRAGHVRRQSGELRDHVRRKRTGPDSLRRRRIIGDGS
jgi:hypothetical protein